MSEDAVQSQLSGHEDRLQRLETTTQDVSVRLAEVATTQTHIRDDLQEHRTDLVKRLDDGFASLHEKIESHESNIKSHSARLLPLESYVADITKSRVERHATAKKVAVGVLLAGAGVFVTKGVELFIAWVSG
jgi:chromosome segregation ATPase